MNSAQALSSPQKISSIFLLSIYGIIPVSLAVIATDYFFFDFRLARFLPSDASQMGWLNILFMLPHVVASVFTFADREYIETYAVRLGLSSFLFAGSIMLLIATTSFSLLVFILSVYTAYHQIAQQTGIASIITKNRSTAHVIWKWMGFCILFFFFLYSAIVPEKRAAMLEGNRDLLQLLGAIFVAAFLAVSTITAWQSKTRMGILFIAANTLMLIIHGFLFSLNLIFFMILIPRVIHDVTAFAFYVSHNKNRNSDTPRNIISKVFKPMRIPEYILTPALALACSLAMTQFMAPLYLIFTLAFLAVFHYYWEGIMWKSGSPHRNYIHV